MWKGIMVLFTLSIGSTPACSQSLSDLLQDLGPDEGAVVLALDSMNHEQRTDTYDVVVQDTAFRALSRDFWDTGLGFLKQYRLAPGQYQLNLGDEGPFFDLTVEPQSVHFVLVSEGTWQVAKQPTAVVSRILDQLQASGDQEWKSANELTTSNGTLYFRAEPPGVRPPPG